MCRIWMNWWSMLFAFSIVQLPWMPAFTSTSSASSSLQFKGTVSWDGFGFWGHAWSVLGLRLFQSRIFNHFFLFSAVFRIRIHWFRIRTRHFRPEKIYNFFVCHFCPLDPDPDSDSGSTDLIESGSEILLFCANFFSNKNAENNTLLTDTVSRQWD